MKAIARHSSAAQRNPMRLAIFWIQRTEINSPPLRLLQSDRSRKKFARFFNSAVVRQHIGGRTTCTCAQYPGQERFSRTGATGCASSACVQPMTRPHRAPRARCDRFWRFLIGFWQNAPFQKAKSTVAPVKKPCFPRKPVQVAIHAIWHLTPPH
jgi:hypothetical protein